MCKLSSKFGFFDYTGVSRGIVLVEEHFPRGCASFFKVIDGFYGERPKKISSDYLIVSPLLPSVLSSSE